jgi:hypothetical protein
MVWHFAGCTWRLFASVSVHSCIQSFTVSSKVWASQVCNIEESFYLPPEYLSLFKVSSGIVSMDMSPDELPASSVDVKVALTEQQPGVVGVAGLEHIESNLLSLIQVAQAVSEQAASVSVSEPRNTSKQLIIQFDTLLSSIERDILREVAEVPQEMAVLKNSYLKQTQLEYAQQKLLHADNNTATLTQ